MSSLHSHSEVLHCALGASTLGHILIAQSQRGICAILMGDDADALAQDLQQRFPKAELVYMAAPLADTLAKVIAFIDNPHLGLLLPLDIRGTEFQQKVWAEMRLIKLGETASYTELAARIGNPKAFRAVAQACAANPIAVAVPCHRVVRSDGGLSGYRWGVERKKILLQKERT